MENKSMRKEYNFINGKKNPYYEKLRKQITINLDEEVIEYFKHLSDEINIPYQSLINMYLSDCVKNKKQITIDWK